MLFLLLLLHTLDSQGRGAIEEDSYWDVDFDQDRNCAQEDKIAELRQKSSEGQTERCFYEPVLNIESNGSVVLDYEKAKAKAFHVCKMKLAQQVERLCDFTAVKSTGKLLYCYDRAVITCCVDEHQCVEDWAQMEDQSLDVARKYLKDPPAYIRKKVKRMGYKTCHILGTSLDASVCAKDCEELEKQKFAVTCKEKGGLFKCCIRRDAAFCHECRFCCTLGMCTYPSPDDEMQVGHAKTLFDEQVCEGSSCTDNQEIKLKDQNNRQMASELFLSEQSIYKKWDYRCLAPYSHEEPAKWKTYDMHAYRIAFTQEALNNVATFHHDPNFNNFIDPEVLKQYVKDPEGTWENSYGFPYTRAVYWDGNDTTTGDASKCWWRCAKLEVGKFAKDCAKSGGFFKCCVSVWNLNSFENSRNKLISEGLIQAEESKSCEPGGTKDPCVVCKAEGMCTLMEKTTGQNKYIYREHYKPEHKVGGPDQTFKNPAGLRFSYCHVGDLCQIPQHWEYDTESYREATTKKEVCKIKRLPLRADATETKNFKAHCRKAHSNNIFLCPEKEIKGKRRKLIRFLNKAMAKHACCKKNKKKDKK